jgi:hypothetical protein
MSQIPLPGFAEDDLVLDLTKKVNTKHEAAKFVINKFLKEKPKNWAREIKIAQTVITKFPEILNLEIPFKLNSLAWLLTDDGKRCVNKFLYQEKACIPNEKEYNIRTEKFGEDKVIESKAKTIRDFLS